MFPSPTGESHFLIIINNQAGSAEPFPSPTGESHYLMKASRDFWEETVKVSVPYRGITFLNFMRSDNRINVAKVFPSPTGESHFLINSQNW